MAVDNPLHEISFTNNNESNFISKRSMGELLNPASYSRENRQRWDLKQLVRNNANTLGLTVAYVLAVGSLFAIGAFSERKLPYSQPTTFLNNADTNYVYESNLPQIIPSTIESDEQGFLHPQPLISTIK